MLALLLFACADRPQVAESWQIDRMRILAVAPEPPEAHPGDTVQFRALIVSPNKPVECSAWLGCSSDSGFGCGFSGSVGDTAAPDTGTGDPSTAFLGIDPYFPPSWTVPADYLDALPEADRLEGTTQLITVLALSDCEALLSGDPSGAQDLLAGGVDDVEIAYKRLPVSLATVPNHNPNIAEILVDDLSLSPGSRITLDRAQTYRLKVVLSDDAVESYDYLNSDGVTETRTEEPYFSWYAQEGSFNQTNTLYPYTEVEYTTPSQSTLETQSLWVVVRDRRGGMGWLELPIALRP